MLRFISIDNFALIDHLEVEFETGLNLITGETGSGKSILVDAVGLLMGGRASQEMIRQGFEKAQVEGQFSVPPESPVTTMLEESGLTEEGGELVIRRELSLGGNNRVFINGRLSTLSLLSELGAHLVDLHGQHGQQQLLHPASHLEFLDQFARQDDLLDRVGSLYRRLTETKRELNALRQSEHERLQRIDLLRYQIAEIEKLQLTSGLDQELLEESRLLSTAEQRLQTAQQAYQLLYEEEGSILSQLDQSRRLVKELSRLDESFQPSLEKLTELQYQLEEIAFQSRDYASEIEFNPARLERVEERLSEIEKAKRKYGRSVDEILSYGQEIVLELEKLENAELEISSLEERLDGLRREYLERSRMLSNQRREAAGTLSRRVQEELGDLAMKNTVFEVAIESDESRMEEKGIDAVEFLISPNPGEAPKPLARIASGGELSRIMLALKSVLKVDEIPRTLVFDEVDAGIGGRTATSLGEKLARLSRRHQVFCVTHLPQIAAFAEQHFHVGKESRRARTVVTLAKLDESARVEELSRMLAGEAVSETTRRQARELLSATGAS